MKPSILRSLCASRLFGLSMPWLAAWTSVHAHPEAAAPVAGSGAVPGGSLGVAHPHLLWLCVLLFAAVFLAMLMAIWWHRRNIRRQGGRMDEPGWVELCWTLIPVLIALGAAWPVFRELTR